MATVPVQQLIPGARLNQHVMTARNNLLLEKGTVLTTREIAILRAFLINQVSVEDETMPSLALASLSRRLGSAADSSRSAETDELAATSTERVAQAADSSNAAKPANASATIERVQPADRRTLAEVYDQLLIVLKRTFELAAAGQPLPVRDILRHMEGIVRHIQEYDVLRFRPNQYSPQDYLYHHSARVAMTSFLLAKWQGFHYQDWVPIALAGLLHNIGNARVNPNLLAKTTSLTAAEYEAIRSHTQIGYSILRPIQGINEAVKLVSLQHHEREDGSGYPYGLKGSSIHPYSKIIAIADIYHAMSANRVYRKAVSPYLVLEQLQQYSFGKLDPVYVRTFISKLTQFHSGTLVILSDDRVGEIVFSERDHPTKPWVKVDGKIIRLTAERDLYIKEVLQS